MANSPWAQFVCISEEDGLIIPISNDVFSVGRAKACDLSMPDNKFISGRHCNLSRKNNTIWLEDTSTNGTWLNGVKIGKGQKQRLFHRDEIAVVLQEGKEGARDIVYRYEDVAMLEAEQERLDQTQEMDDPDENTEDYVFEDKEDEEGASRKRKKDEDSDDGSKPAKRLEAGEEDVNKDDKIPSEDPAEKLAGEAASSVSVESSNAIEDTDKAAASEKGDGDTEKKKKEGVKSPKEEEEESDDILETLICSICQDILHKCISLQPCMHSFCAACISGWMKHSKRCPQCRKHVKRIGHNYIVNSLVDAYLKQNPDKKRTKEDLEEMDARCSIPFNKTFDYDPMYDEDEEGDYDPDDEEDYEEEEEEEEYVPPPPPACRQCPHYVQPLDRDAVMSLQTSLDPSTSTAAVPGNAPSTSSRDAAVPSTSSATSSSPSKRVRIAVGGIPVPMPTPPPFQCNLDALQHVACTCCLQPMPNRTRAPDIPPQICRICRRSFCHMYWGCKQYNCLGCLNRFRDMKFSESVLDTIINNNRYESTIFKDFMLSKGHHNIHLVLQEVLSGLAANNYRTDETQLNGISGHSPLCYTCALRIFQGTAYLYRASIPKNDLPILVTARPDCHWGRACRTQYNKPHHAANFNHICDQVRF
ncbi:E3 ubiquitin-protein ligase CHFR-like [Lytechinus variegatus]|uniref:E3 ubiquitin-protein ligase CHFR-like n=1 Tax=Lytechinus variegatus TaxID=7654 RepID=UPI001BB14FC0|nr:E3 ubiquitin-protein ligase CHFR-like [Lytechinus variegatus]